MKENSVAVWYSSGDRICNMYFYKKNNNFVSWKIRFSQVGILSDKRITIKL